MEMSLPAIAFGTHPSTFFVADVLRDRLKLIGVYVAVLQSRYGIQDARNRRDSRFPIL